MKRSNNTQDQMLLEKAINDFDKKNFPAARSWLLKFRSRNPNHFDSCHLLAVTFALMGEHKNAIKIYEEAINIKPNDTQMLSNFASSLNAIGEHQYALTILNKSLLIEPDNYEYLFNKGNILCELNLHTESLSYYKKSFEINPYFPPSFNNYGKALFDLMRFEESLDYFDKAINLDPSYIECLNNKGIALKELKKFDEALIYLQSALNISSNAETLLNIGSINLAQKKYHVAIDYFDKALQLEPNFAEAWSNKGNALYELNRPNEAIVHFDKALSLKPTYTIAWCNKGWVLQKLKCFDEAIAHYDKALSIKPTYVIGWSSKGWLLHELKLFDNAIAHYDKALSINSNYAEAWANKGNALFELKRYDEAITHYEKALQLNNSMEWIAADLLHTKMMMCNWSGFEDGLNRLWKNAIDDEYPYSPFIFITLSDDLEFHKKSAKIYTKSRHPANSSLGPILKPSKSEKIRLGYFSADYHNHATGHLIAELFELHDKTRFELIGFSFGPIKNDDMRARLEESFDQFIEVGNRSDGEIAQLSRDLNIDIAIDLKGFTQDSRPSIFAHRAAPIQVNYLGYPGTMGADYMDFIIADKVLIPAELQNHYSEKIIYLPNSYQVNDRKRVISDKQFTRVELGLPETGFVFCCFNNNYKILPATFTCWMRILKAIEGSVLWLLQDNHWVIENLRNEAQKQGVDPIRLVFANRMPLPEHLARHRQADLFLDTFPYNAHTTASDALWSGLPLLTLVGQSFASRVAASLLTAIGLQELITKSQIEYEGLAIELATDHKKLIEIKSKLSNNRFDSPLFDTPLFTKHLELAYIQMYQRHLEDSEPIQKKC